ncbi:MAG: hypothetical protein ACRD42_03990 [Nitrososphaeraceae archaeon]
MLIRHCVEESNVDENGQVLDPMKIRHVTLRAGKLDSLSGLIDPASHLNLDYPDHKVTTCVITEKFSVGAPIRFSGQGLLFAIVNRSSFIHYGFIDYTQRLASMIDAVKEKKKENAKHLAVGSPAKTRHQEDYQ